GPPPALRGRRQRGLVRRPVRAARRRVGAGRRHLERPGSPAAAALRRGHRGAGRHRRAGPGPPRRRTARRRQGQLLDGRPRRSRLGAAAVRQLAAPPPGGPSRRPVGRHHRRARAGRLDLGARHRRRAAAGAAALGPLPGPGEVREGPHRRRRRRPAGQRHRRPVERARRRRLGRAGLSSGPDLPGPPTRRLRAGRRPGGCRGGRLLTGRGAARLGAAHAV
ncbi:MAG: hypothetical protein AVDCRST_MAG07-389, partial [uncultured Frankineae bacterium]